MAKVDLSSPSASLTLYNHHPGNGPENGKVKLITKTHRSNSTLFTQSALPLHIQGIIFTLIAIFIVAPFVVEPSEDERISWSIKMVTIVLVGFGAAVIATLNLGQFEKNQENTKTVTISTFDK